MHCYEFNKSLFGINLHSWVVAHPKKPNAQVQVRAADRLSAFWNVVIEPLARVAWQNLIVSSTRNMGKYIAIVQENNLIDIH